MAVTRLKPWVYTPSISDDGLTYIQGQLIGYNGAKSTTYRSNGKIMFESTILAQPNYGQYAAIGISDDSVTGISYILGYDSYGYGLRLDGVVINNNITKAYMSALTTGDVIGVLVDMDNKTVSFAKNGVNYGIAYTFSNITKVVAAVIAYLGNGVTNSSYWFNFGNFPFSYPIDGYEAFGEPLVPINYSGILIENDMAIAIENSYNTNGTLTEELGSGEKAGTSTGFSLPENQLSTKNLRNYPAVQVWDVSAGDQYEPTIPGIKVIDILTGVKKSIGRGLNTSQVELGIRNKDYPGYLADIQAAVRQPTNFIGYHIDIETSSNADSKYNLIVTPTHQYKSQLVRVQAISKTSIHFVGKYNLSINGSIVIPCGNENADISNIDLTLNPIQLITGKNNCRLSLFYSNGVIEYLDFEIVKEESKRTVVERLFKSYDGGFSGEAAHPSIVYAGSLLYPCFLVPYGNSNTLIKTTDTTRISLSRYLDIQGVSVVGDGLRILVSFNKGITWRSFIDNSWQTTSIDNISTAGMSVATINSITLAQWSDIFIPTSLDFAILIDNTTGIASLIGEAENLLASGNLWSDGNNQHPAWNTLDYYPSNIDPNLKFSKITSGGTGYGNIYIHSNIGTTRFDGPFTYNVAYNEEVSHIAINAQSWSGYASVTDFAVYTKPRIAYLKSINVLLTPKLKSSYSYIM